MKDYLFLMFILSLIIVFFIINFIFYIKYIFILLKKNQILTYELEKIIEKEFNINVENNKLKKTLDLHKKIIDNFLEIKNQSNNLISDSNFICVICLENSRCIIGLECKHLICCELCCLKLNDCPICRKDVTFEKIYLS